MHQAYVSYLFIYGFISTCYVKYTSFYYSIDCNVSKQVWQPLSFIHVWYPEMR